MDVEIVDADFENAAHCAGLIDVLNSYAADPVGGGEPLAADVCDRLVPALREHPTSLVLLAVARGCPVGIAVCFLGFSTFRARPLLNIHDLAVLPEWRGKGVGRSLLAAAEDRARRRGCCRLTLEVQDDNERARGLYGSFGFSDLTMGNSGPTRFLTKPVDAPTGA
jgi:GNAT superfamily N-acetyltransferase